MPSSSRGMRSAKPLKVASIALRASFILLPLLLLLAPSKAQAYTWMIKHAYTACTACHADPSGGELLTAYGRGLSEWELSTNWSKGGGEGSGASRSGRKSLALQRTPESLRADSFAARAKAADKEEPITLEEDPAPATDADAASSADAPAEAEAEASPEAAPEEAAAPAAEGEKDEEYFFGAPFFGAFKLPDWLLLGASYRHLNILTPSGPEKFRTFPMMMDVYGQLQLGMFRAGGSVGAARVAKGSPFARAAQVTANQGKEWNLISRTHYLGVDVMPELTLRAGRLNLPFGVRIPEHTMWVRQQTRTDRESGQQHGVAAAYTGEQLRGELMAIAGNYQINPDKYRERGYSGYLEYFTGTTTAIGISSLVTVAKEDRVAPDGLQVTRHVHGGLLRAAFNEEVVLLAEVNALLRSRREIGYVGFTQLDYEPIQGLHFMLTGEVLDEGHSKALDAPARREGAGKPKLGGWLSAAWFILPHFDVRLDGIQRQGEDLQILAQLHVYL